MHVIACDDENDWPARSPDLTPCDFLLCGYLKGKIFTSPPPSITVLKRRINAEFTLLKQNPNLVKKAMRDMMRRATHSIDIDGAHVEGRV